MAKAQRRATAPTVEAPIEENYDAVPYPTHPNVSAHPDRLATIATLRGLKAAPIDRCRVLEVGCGDGGNLLAAAVALPASEFVGIDLSGEAIRRGVGLAQAAGIENARLLKVDLRALPVSAGKFDYIIAHGVYSWVPQEVRQALLALIGERLMPNGVAFVSYNAMPGGHIRRALRDMTFFHLRNTPNPAERIDEAKALMELLLAAEMPGIGGYRAMLTEQAGIIRERTDADLFHDELAPINDSFYVTEFAAHAKEHGLQYLGEAEYFTMTAERAGPVVANALASLDEADPLLKEQYLDFVTCRLFRKTLLCRADVKLAQKPDPAAIAALWASSNATAEPEQEDGRQTFASDDHGGLTTADPRAKAMMHALSAASPAALPFTALVDAVVAVSPETSRFKAAERVAAFFESAYAAGVIELHSRALHVVTAPADAPLASPLARAQASAGPEVSSLRHTEVVLDDVVARGLIQLLDGTRDRAALLALLQEAGVEGETPEHLDEKLRELGRLGLLVR